MIEVENLSKVFWDRQRGAVYAVDGISFEVRPGEIFGLLGPNGAGKTTTLRILSTVLKPTSGKTKLAHFDVVSQPQEVRQNLGFISNSTGIYEKLTPTEMVEYFGRLYGLTKNRIAERTKEIFSLLAMEEFAHTLNGKLSSGMKQKVSLARTIVHDPPVLIFDEPTVSLDILVAKTVVDFIALCRTQKKCILLSTHIMSEAEKLCDRVGILHQGKILAMGTVEELKRQTQQKTLEEVFFSLVSNEKKVG